jgi:hypothetical protein
VSNILIRAVLGALYLGLALWVLTAAMNLCLPLLALFDDSSVRWSGSGFLLSIFMLALAPRLWRSLRRLKSDLGLVPRREGAGHI